MTEIELRWQGPLHFSDLIASKVDRNCYNFPGLYLWKTTEPDREIIYVGKSQGSVYQRLAQEYLLFVSGAFKIPAYFRETEEDWEYNLSSDRPLDELFEQDKFLALAKSGFDFANSLRIFVASVKEHEKSIINDAERLLIYKLQPERNVRGCGPLPDGFGLSVLSNAGFEKINRGITRGPRLESIYLHPDSAATL